MTARRGGLARRALPAGVAVALAVAGCATARAEEAVQQVADRLAPGRYTVVAAEPLGASGRTRVVLADGRDADAAVVVAVDSTVDAAGDCGPGSRCEQEVRDAVDRSGPQAAEHRALVGAFERCGHPVVAVSGLPTGPGEGQAEPWVAATIAGEPITGLLAELDTCVAGWRAERAAAPSPWAATPVGLTLRVVDPAAVASAPAPDPTLPPAVRASDERLAALSRGSQHAAVLGPQDREPVGTRLYPVLSGAPAAAFDAAVTGAARAWLTGTDPAAEVDRHLAVATRVEPADPTRLRVYVLLARRPDGAQPAVAMTVDRAGGAAAEHAVVPDVRRPDGTVRLPVEPYR